MVFIVHLSLQIDDEPFNPDYTVADRILDIASQIEPSGEVSHYYSNNVVIATITIVTVTVATLYIMCKYVAIFFMQFLSFLFYW